MTRNWLLIAGGLCLAVLPSLTAPAEAAKPKKEPPPQSSANSGSPNTEALGKVGPWSAYASRDKSGRICYLVSQPQKSDSPGLARRSPVVMVTHRPSENIANVVSFIEGYPLKEGSEVVLEVDDRKFELFTNDDSAWARTAELDRTIVSAFIKGKSAVVKGTPQKGKPTTDTYSLSGFTKALALIDTACGIKRAETASAEKSEPPKKRKPRPAKP